jgi:hypothetical protein
MVVTPGRSRVADTAVLYGIDPVNYADGPVSDVQGRITSPPWSRARPTVAILALEPKLNLTRISPSSQARSWTWATS